MIRFLIPVMLFLSACGAGGSGGGDGAAAQFAPEQREAALQRMRFVAEAVCLNNRTARAQDRAARALGFPIRERRGGGVIYANPGTLTILRLAPAPPQTVSLPGGGTRVYRGMGCAVGSPAVSVRTANRLVGEILTPRLVEGDRSVSQPVSAGQNDTDGAGFFFDDLAITVPPVRNVVVDKATGRGVAYRHPEILIVHGGR